MMLGVKVWALAHLLANNTLARCTAVRRLFTLGHSGLPSRAPDATRLNPPPAQQAKASATVLTLLVGVAAWAAFAFWGHLALIGVRPLG